MAATPRSDETQISMTTFLIGVVVVVGGFIAVQIGRVVLAPDAPPPAEVVEAPEVPVEEPVEDVVVDDGPKERPFEYESPLDGKVEYDEIRDRLVVTQGEERSTFDMKEIVGLEREPNGAINLRAKDGHRVAVSEEFVNELPTRVRYQFDYESSGNVATDGKGTPLDSEGRPITNDN